MVWLDLLDQQVNQENLVLLEQREVMEFLEHLVQREDKG